MFRCVGRMRTNCEQALLVQYREVLLTSIQTKPRQRCQGEGSDEGSGEGWDAGLDAGAGKDLAGILR
jgi:hypothetical protein